MNTIITGASSNHFQVLQKLLRSVRQFHKADEMELAIWDLGLTEQERAALETEFQTPVRVFHYSNYPPYYNIQVAAGEYAWKPALIKETRQALGERTYLWLDAGNRIMQSLDKLFLLLDTRGFFSNATHGTVQTWTSPKMFESLDPKFQAYIPNKMRNGAIIGFNERLPWIRELMDTYAEWANTKAIIAPEGSSRDNHRQDQSCLTLLYWDYARTNPFHTDIPCASIIVHSDHIKN